MDWVGCGREVALGTELPLPGAGPGAGPNGCAPGKH